MTEASEQRPPAFRWNGSFVDPALETEFLRDEAEPLRNFLRFSLPLASLVFLAYGLHDALLVRPVLRAVTIAPPGGLTASGSSSHGT